MAALLNYSWQLHNKTLIFKAKMLRCSIVDQAALCCGSSDRFEFVRATCLRSGGTGCTKRA